MARPCFVNQLKYSDVIQKEDIADIWKYAKDAYIDKGAEISDTIHGVSKDLGLKQEWVARAFTEPKSIRPITNEMYKRMSDRRQVVQEAKDIVRGLDTPFLKKAFQTVWRTPFAVAVAGHGTVGMQTHVGAALFRPTTWNTYFSNFARQYKYSIQPAVHEAAMQELVRRDNFITAKRAGLANDPMRTYTDYGMYAQWIPKVLGKAIGQRGFDVLKMWRQDAFDHEWGRVPESIKSDPAAAKDMAANIASMVNHASGVADIGHGPIATGASNLAFAAKLEAARWARIIGDPLKTAETFGNWKNASAADRHIAMTRLKHAAEFTGFYFTTLLANNAILAALGSKDRVNLSDPTKSDWMKHKLGGGRSIALEGNLIAPIRLLAGLAYAGWGPRKPYQKMESRFETATKLAGSYVRGKLAPAAGIAVDVATQTDFSGRPLPFSSDKPRKGKEPLTYTEYVSEHGPIPLSGAIREIYDEFRTQGMEASTATSLIRGLAVLGAETTGAKVGHASHKKESNVGTLQKKQKVGSAPYRPTP